MMLASQIIQVNSELEAAVLSMQKHVTSLKSYATSLLTTIWADISSGDKKFPKPEAFESICESFQKTSTDLDNYHKFEIFLKEMCIDLPENLKNILQQEMLTKTATVLTQKRFNTTHLTTPCQSATLVSASVIDEQAL